MTTGEKLKYVARRLAGDLVERDLRPYRERLEAVPHAKLCLKCKSEQEGSRGASR